jgi:hypothetical protein
MSPSLIPDVIPHSRQSVLWSGIADTSAAPAEEVPGWQDAVFFCLHPPPEIAERVRRIAANLRERYGLSCPLIRARCLHISLLGFGHHGALSQAAIAALRATAASVTMPSFRVSLSLARSFRGNPNLPFVLTGDEGVSRDRDVSAGAHPGPLESWVQTPREVRFRPAYDAILQRARPRHPCRRGNGLDRARLLPRP